MRCAKIVTRMSDHDDDGDDGVDGVDGDDSDGKTMQLITFG